MVGLRELLEEMPPFMGGGRHDQASYFRGIDLERAALEV